MPLEIPKVTSTPVGQPVQVTLEEAIADAKKDVNLTNGEKKTETGNEDPTSQESFSKRFAALNRERKGLTQKEIEVKKREAALEAREAAIAQKEAEEAEIKKSLNPLKALEKYGYKYEDAAQFMLNDEKPTPDLAIKSVKDEVLELKKMLADKESENERIRLEADQVKLQEQSHKSNQEAITAIKEHLDKKPEFDALIALGMQDDIFNQINAHYEKTGEVLKIDDVATSMLSEVEKMLGVVTKTNIYKTKFGSSQQVVKDKTKTLSNALTSQTVPKEKQAYKSDADREKNAIALLSK